jgi:hypothetical protein
MNATCRRQRWLIGLGLLSTALGAAFAVGGMCFFLEDAGNPQCPLWGNIFMAVGFLFCVMLCGIGGLYVVADAIRHRLTVEGDDLTLVQVFRTKRICLAAVVEAR